MSIGLGVFLGLVFLGLVVLYTKNRDSISMKKILKWIGIVVGIIVLLFVLIYLGFYLKDKYDSRPQVISEFRNIRIGDTSQQVKFKIGQLTLNEKVTKESIEDYPMVGDGFYSTDQDRLRVNIVNGKVESVIYHCDQDNVDFTKINEISCGDNGEKIQELFAKDVQIYCHLDDGKTKDYELMRVYITRQYHVRYHLYQNMVVGFKFANPDDLTSPKNKKWGECK